MHGLQRLREGGNAVSISLRELADDLADYAAARPDAQGVVDAVATYIASLYPASRQRGLIRALPSTGELLPGEAADMAANGDTQRWVDVYRQLIDAADSTGMGVDVQVHLLARLAYWRSRTPTSVEVQGHAAAVPQEQELSG